MAESVGPGTRLLCIEDTPSLRSGTIYTCRAVLSLDDISAIARSHGYGGAYCVHHANNCRLGGVLLMEIRLGRMLLTDIESPFCLACFRPLGGELPAEILRCLEVAPTTRPLVEAWAC